MNYDEIGLCNTNVFIGYYRPPHDNVAAEELAYIPGALRLPFEESKLTVCILEF